MTIGTALAGFAVVAGLLTVVPGLDTALVLRAAIANGRRHAFATAVGVSAGTLVWGVAAAVGVSALLAASSLASTLVRVAGAAYMVWIGVRLLWAARSAPVEEPDAASSGPGGASAWSGWRRGLLTNLLNPKVGAFYVAVIPQFLPVGVSPLVMGILLALVHDALALVWFGALIAAASTMRRLLQRRAARRAVDGVTGAVLVGFGVRLGLTR
jgi:threonine/homoserine/homoserine lactone efflux protein